MKTTTPRRCSFRPQLESLEGRSLMVADLLPAPIVSQIDAAGNLAIVGTAGNDVVRVSEAVFSDVKWVNVEANGRTQWFPQSQIKTGAVVFSGGLGNDYFRNDGNSLQTVTFGGAGNDILIGGNQNDQLVRGEGDDQLFGEGGNDQI